MPRTHTGQTRREIYRFVRDRILRGDPPSIREVQTAFGFRAVQSAREHLEALVAGGLLAKAPGKARGFRLPTGPGRTLPTRLVPVLGRIQAGAWTTALTEAEGYLAIPSRVAEADLFGLRVHGESMTGAGILPADIVIVRRQPSALSGEIVVAMVGEEATVKTLRIRRRRIELVPAHPDFEILTPDPAELKVLGKVIEVRRYLDRTPLITLPEAATAEGLE